MFVIGTESSKNVGSQREQFFHKEWHSTCYSERVIALTSSTYFLILPVRFLFRVRSIMKSYHFIIISLLISLYSCSYAPLTSGPITIVQLNSLDFNSIRPRLVTLLGSDSSGLAALSMITTYEDFLLDNFPIDTSYERAPDKLPNSSAMANLHEILLEMEQLQQPNIRQNKSSTTNLFLQILHQNLLKWMNELDKFHSDFIYTNDIKTAKKGAAAGYNALISGPSVNDIPKITDKMQSFLDSLYKQDTRN